MSKYPVGPGLDSIGTTVKNVPAPPPLWLFYIINGLALLTFCILLIGMQFKNTQIIAANTLSGGLFVFHAFFMSIAVIWAIMTNRRISRFLCMFNSAALSTLFVYMAYSITNPWTLSLIATATFLLATSILFGARTAKAYYAVLAGNLAIEDYQPFSLRSWKLADRFGIAMGYIGETFIFLLALFVIIRFILVSQ